MFFVISACMSLIRDICCLLHWETAVTFVLGLLLERKVIFRAGEEWNITVGNQQQMEVSPCEQVTHSQPWAALWLKHRFIFSESEQTPPRVGAEEPGSGPGVLPGELGFSICREFSNLWSLKFQVSQQMNWIFLLFWWVLSRALINYEVKFSLDWVQACLLFVEVVGFKCHLKLAWGNLHFICFLSSSQRRDCAWSPVFHI